MTIPVPSKIKLAGENNCLTISWSDGHASAFPYRYLRDHCPCAICNDARAKKVEGKAKEDGSDLLPIYKPRVKAKSATAVGNYAIQIEFSDGHATGIYSFECLRECYPCEACLREFGGEMKRANT